MGGNLSYISNQTHLGGLQIMLYDLTLILHNITRWLVLIVALVVIIRSLIGWFGKRDWADTDDKLGMAYTSVMDLQLLLGLLLYFIFSPVTKGAFSNIGAAMSNSDVRFFLVEHLLVMLIAIILAHIGRSRTKKVETSHSKYKNAAIFYGISFLLVLAAIPWFRSLLPF